MLSYTQSLYLVGPGGLVISPATPDSRATEVAVVLRQRTQGEPGQLFELRKDGRLINGEGYCLEVLCALPSPGVFWEFEHSSLAKLLPALFPVSMSVTFF